MKKALITGITGQDGSYLSELLLQKGYDVIGMYRRTSTDNFERINHIKNKLKLIDGDLIDTSSLIRIIKDTQPNEVYNLAAQSFVPNSWTEPEATSDITGLGVLRLLEAIRIVDPTIKFYQASSSEQFGKVHETPQTENTPFHPRSPYGVAKVFGYWMTRNYRESYNMHASNGILFNHESPRRGEQFVTRKITKTITEIVRGEKDCLEIGNLSAKRDWGFAGDYVEAMWLMLQQDKPDDYVISSGTTHTVREFVELAFKQVNIDIAWEGEGINEVGKDAKSNNILVKVNPKFYRPAEVDLLLGDSSKAKQVLNWQPTTTLEQLISMMVTNDL